MTKIIDRIPHVAQRIILRSLLDAPAISVQEKAELLQTLNEQPPAEIDYSDEIKFSRRAVVVS